MREYEARHKAETNDTAPFLTPQPSIKRKGGRRRRRSNESISVYRGERDFYEKLMSALPGEEVAMKGDVGIDELITKTESTQITNKS